MFFNRFKLKPLTFHFTTITNRGKQLLKNKNFKKIYHIDAIKQQIIGQRRAEVALVMLSSINCVIII